jgi:phosphoribosylanthranilate isomerase
MWVKICANTNLHDAALAAELGADAVGFVFAASKRQVSVAEVAAITAALPASVERIGVFDSHTAEEITDAVSTARLSGVQVHRELDIQELQRLRLAVPGTVEIIPTLHWAVDDSSAAVHIAAQLEKIAATGLVRRLLIDSKVNGTSGGTGIGFDWPAARQVFLQAPSNLELILAGGLKPDTVAAAIVELHPFGVDVTSGVESAPRRKDPAQIASFIRNARSALNG